MTDNSIIRRSITITAVAALFTLLTVLSPVVFLVAVAVDVARLVLFDKPWVTLRCLGFLWLYLLGEIWAVAALTATALLMKDAKAKATIALQGRWVAWNVGALVRLFDLEFSVEPAEDDLSTGPMLVLVRHASLVDTLLPGMLIANAHQIRLRYVLKKELLVDPALDIAGNRLPNYFIDRAATTAVELKGIRALARDLATDEGVLIYPEGTRFTEAKRNQRVKRVVRGGGELAEMARSMRMVLPPRPGGTLVLLDETEADVVVLAHHGLEGLATVKDIWSGGLVGSRILVKMWRIPRSTIPSSNEHQKRWLFQVWCDVDTWLADVSEEVSAP